MVAYSPGPAYSDPYANFDRTATNPLWQAWADTLKPAATPAGPVAPPPDTYDPTAAMRAEFDRQQAALRAQQDAQNLARRTSAWDELYATLKQYGIDMDGGGLAATVKGWVFEDKTAASIMMNLRATDAYNKRFTGMAALIKRGQAISESEYIAQERSYANVLRQWNMPTGFYDDPADFGKFIANGVSVKELDDRIVSAKTFLDTSAPTEYKNALRDLGVSEGGMLAHLLDGDVAQSVIQREVKTAAMQGAANINGFGLNTADAAKYGGTLGDQYNAFGVDQRNALEKNLAELGVQARNDVRLSSIDKENATLSDTLDANLLNDSAKLTASQRRALREGARFSGSSGVTTGSLSRNSGA